jgi:peroxiredoxin Q/BCP
MQLSRRAFAAAIAALAALASAGMADVALAAGLSAGTVAPKFRLPDQDGKLVALDDFKGKWVVLYFYPKDHTPGCTTEACEFRDNIFAFREAGAVILGISVDDVDSHKDFATENRLPFKLLADAGKATAKAYGVLYKAMGLLELARRETFIIDPEGRIAKQYPDVDPKSHTKLVLADLKSLQRH